MSKFNNYANFNTSKLQYKCPEKLENNTFVASLQNNEVLFETPIMTIFGDPEYNRAEDCYELNLQFSVNDEKFYNTMRNIDEYNTEYIYKYSGQWFETEFPRNVINEFYESNIYNWLDPEKNVEIPFLKLNIPCDSKHNLLVDIVDNDTYTSLSSLKNNLKVFCQIELSGLKFLKQRLVTDWNVRSIHIFNEHKVNLTDHLINNKYNTKVIDEEMLHELAVESRIDSSNPESSPESSLELPLSQSYDKFSSGNSHSLHPTDNRHLYHEASIRKMVPVKEVSNKNIAVQTLTDSHQDKHLDKHQDKHLEKTSIRANLKINTINKNRKTSSTTNTLNLDVDTTNNKEGSQELDRNLENSCNSSRSNNYETNHKISKNDYEDELLSQLRDKRNELEKFLSEATEANKVASKLNEEAKKRAEEIETMSRSINSVKH